MHGVFEPGRRLLTTGLVLIVTFVAFESMAVATVMPLVEDDLGALGLYGWVFSGFFLGSLVGVVVAATAGDRMRPVVPFTIGLTLFSVGLLVGGLAPSMLVLVIGRVLQGLGAGVMPATSYLCIGRAYSDAQRPTMFALISSAWMVPSVVGPVVAAWVGASIGWRWVFLALLPLCAVIGVVALLGVRTVAAPETPSSERNVLNAFRIAIGAGLVLFGLGGHGPILTPVALVFGGLLAVPAFRRLTPVGTLRAAPGLPATVAVRGLLNLAFFAADSWVPFAMTSVRGLPTVWGGLALTAGAILWTAGSWLQARWIRVVGADVLVRRGMVLIAIGAAGMVLILLPAVPAQLALALWAVAGLGMGLAYSPLAVVAMEAAERGGEGRVTAALQMSDMLGVALGTGIAGAIVAGLESLTGSTTTGLVTTFLVAGTVGVGAALASFRVPPVRELA